MDPALDRMIRQRDIAILFPLLSLWLVVVIVVIIIVTVSLQLVQTESQLSLFAQPLQVQLVLYVSEKIGALCNSPVDCVFQLGAFLDDRLDLVLLYYIIFGCFVLCFV